VTAKSDKQGKSSRRGEGERTSAEVITLAASVLLLVALVGSLIYVELSRGDALAGIEVTPAFEDAFERDGDWYLPVEVTNSGDESTDMVRVDLVRPIPGEQPEVAELEFVFLAGGESMSGVAVFDERPTKDTIEIDEMSYTDP